MIDPLVFVLGGMLAAGTPLLFAALGELVAEKSGVLNLSVEGMMAVGAAVGFVTATVSGSHTFGFVSAGFASATLAAVFAVLALNFLASQVAAGLAVGILGLGLSALIGKNYEGTTITALAELNFPILSDIPLIGPVLFGQDLMVYVGLMTLILVWYVLTRTKVGLIIRSIGENPDAAHAIGYPVILIRFSCVVFGGFLAGIGGAYLTLAYTPLWAEGLVAGRGWIAVALVVFGSWRAPRVALGAWLFGAVSLLELFVQGLGFAIPSQVMSATPYVITIIVLALISRDRRQISLNSPMSLALPFRK